MNWVITIPKTVAWEKYEKELAAVADGNSVLNYRTRYFPKEMKVNDRCYVLWNGKVRGWMRIVGLMECDESWTCETTGAGWPAGKYIQRSGKFYEYDGPEMTGFRGIRKLDLPFNLDRIKEVSKGGVQRMWELRDLIVDTKEDLPDFLMFIHKSLLREFKKVLVGNNIDLESEEVVDLLQEVEDEFKETMEELLQGERDEEHRETNEEVYLA